MDCVLHIGTEKTATTLLQSWLYSNREALSAQGVFLSSVLKEGNNRKLVSYFQPQIDDWLRRQHISTEAEKTAFFDGFEAAFRDEVQTAGATHHTMIITSEHFHSRLRQRDSLASLRALLTDLFDSVRVVCYFRDQADYAVSTYSTKLRNAYTESLETFIASITEDGYYFNHEASADLWASVFGDAACHFSVFDRSTFVDGDIRRDFLSHLPRSIKGEQLDYGIDRRNESLSGFRARLFRVINKRIPHWKPGRMGINRLNKKLKASVEQIESLNQGSLEAAKQPLRDKFADSNQRFLERWMPERQDLLDHSSSQPTEAPSDFDADAVESLLAELMDTITHRHLSGGRVLLDEDAQELVAFYDRYRAACPADLEGARLLLALAQRARPGGKVILDRLEVLENEAAQTDGPEASSAD